MKHFLAIALLMTIVCCSADKVAPSRAGVVTKDATASNDNEYIYLLRVSYKDSPFVQEVLRRLGIMYGISSLRADVFFVKRKDSDTAALAVKIDSKLRGYKVFELD